MISPRVIRPCLYRLCLCLVEGESVAEAEKGESAPLFSVLDMLLTSSTRPEQQDCLWYLDNCFRSAFLWFSNIYLLVFKVESHTPLGLPACFPYSALRQIHVSRLEPQLHATSDMPFRLKFIFPHCCYCHHDQPRGPSLLHPALPKRSPPLQLTHQKSP
jgi:hypothetical protein